MNLINLQLASLPIQLILAENGQVAFQKMGNFKTILDQPETGVQAIIDDDGIYIGAETEVCFNTLYNYKEMPELLAWLQQMNLEAPNLEGF